MIASLDVYGTALMNQIYVHVTKARIMSQEKEIVLNKTHQERFNYVTNNK